MIQFAFSRPSSSASFPLQMERERERLASCVGREGKAAAKGRERRPVTEQPPFLSLKRAGLFGHRRLSLSLSFRQVPANGASRRDGMPLATHTGWREQRRRRSLVAREQTSEKRRRQSLSRLASFPASQAERLSLSPTADFLSLVVKSDSETLANKYSHTLTSPETSAIRSNCSCASVAAG